MPDQPEKAVFFFSDAHLDAHSKEKEEKKKRLLIRFLKMVRDEGSHLYIVGDLFDFWFEYRGGYPRRDQEVLSALKEVTDSGVAATLLGGNHDWWAGESFTESTCVKVAKSDLAVNHFGKRIFITHGDGLAKKDWGYRLLRKIFRNPVNIFLYGLVPPVIGIPLAKAVSGKSRDYRDNRDLSYLKDYDTFAQKMIESGCDAVIIAHTHRPVLKEIGKGVYLNCGNWIYSFTYGKLDAGGLSLNTFQVDRGQGTGDREQGEVGIQLDLLEDSKVDDSA
jgi:UDP-2,3-diacylglucosamine hydrolase